MYRAATIAAQPEIAAAVALGEFERMDDLVAMRTAVGLAFMAALEGCRWLKPQKVLEGCVSSWYTVGLLIDRPDVAWLEFRRKFVEMGGDGFCEYTCTTTPTITSTRL
eukprot:SAG31_NODE_1461_length_8244_cov_4.587109_3_plen_108_part_00